MKAPTPTDFKKIVNSMGNLYAEGLLYPAFFKLHTSVDPEKSKASLLKAFNQFQLCYKWLSNCQPTQKATASSPESYKLKHMVESHNNGTYISNGAMIAAAIYLQFPTMLIRDSPYITIGISRKSPCFIAGIDAV